MNLANEANLALQEQARGHANALERYQQEAVLKNAADKNEAQNAFYEMHRRDLRREAEMNQLQLSLRTAELALVQKETERVQQLATAYLQRTPSGSHKGDSSDSVNYYDVSPRGSLKSQPGMFATLTAGVFNPFANTFKAEGSERATTEALTTALVSASGENSST